MSPVSRYAVIRELGRGGMGIVYLAQDTLLKRQVVIKTLLPPPDQNQDSARTQATWDVMLQRRFIREA